MNDEFEFYAIRLIRQNLGEKYTWEDYYIPYKWYIKNKFKKLTSKYY